VTAPVVADASPLIAFQQIGQLTLLRGTFAELIVPPAVAREIQPSVPSVTWIVERPCSSSRRPSHRVEPITLPPLEPNVVRETREFLRMSRQVFAFKLGVNPRTLERWEQGRSKPNDQAAALIWLVRKYPDTLERLESLSIPA
jgi:putative transcriptional regulator